VRGGRGRLIHHNEYILCDLMRSRPGSQTLDLGFVLQPLYDAILPRLNWHLHHGILQHDGAAYLPPCIDVAHSNWHCLMRGARGIVQDAIAFHIFVY
jgi:hypothetical protein